MFIKMLMAAGLVVGTLVIHAVGFDAKLRVIVRSRALALSGFHRVAPLVILVTCWLVVIHIVEISAWGLFYLWQGCLPDVESAFFFSGVTYTTVG